MHKNIFMTQHSRLWFTGGTGCINDKGRRPGADLRVGLLQPSGKNILYFKPEEATFAHQFSNGYGAGNNITRLRIRCELHKVFHVWATVTDSLADFSKIDNRGLAKKEEETGSMSSYLSFPKLLSLLTHTSSI